VSDRDLLALSRKGPVHFMGIGGAGMCSLAEALVRSGGEVTGCDLRTGPVTERLEALGARVERGHDPAHLEGVVALVTTSAIPSNHAELARARELGIPVLKRAQALGDLVNGGTVVAVAGTHGKTTTTAMLTEILVACGRDPTGLVGGPVVAWQGNLRFGASDLFVVEADEFDRSFHTLEPDVAVLTNVEADHLDVYGDLEGVRQGFRDFLAKVDPDGRVLVCGDDVGASRMLPAAPVPATTYGLSAGCQLRGVDVVAGPGGTRCQVLEEGRDRGRIEVPIPGQYNLRNALGAAAAARALDAPWDAIREGLSAFQGVHRRFQVLGEVGGVTVVDDYAHHPTEVAAILEALLVVYPGRRVVAVFQPHLFTRTRDFAGDFGRALARADVVWVTDIYPARESPIPGVTGELVVGEVRKARGEEDPVRYHPLLEGLAAAVAGDVRPGDVVVTLGAGSIEALGPEVVRRLGGAHEAGAVHAPGGSHE